MGALLGPRTPTRQQSQRCNCSMSTLQWPADLSRMQHQHLQLSTTNNISSQPRLLLQTPVEMWSWAALQRRQRLRLPQAQMACVLSRRLTMALLHRLVDPRLQQKRLRLIQQEQELQIWSLLQQTQRRRQPRSQWQQRLQ
jgi:hypothetical protein